MVNGECISFLIMNRNKKSVTLNLKNEDGKKILFDLIKTADVVVENFRPGATKRLGIDYESVRQVKPDIIYASLSGYGQSGPDMMKGAYANLAEAQSGFMGLTGFPDEEGGSPTASGVAIGDSVAGMFLVQGIMYALFHHERTGEGQYIDIAMTDALIALLQHGIINKSILGYDPPRVGNRDLADYPNGSFKAKDGWCQLANATVSDWSRFAFAIDRPDLAEREDLVSPEGRWEHINELHDIIADWASQRTRAEIEERFGEFGQLYSPILKPSEVMTNPQALHREMIVDMEYRGLKYQMQGIPLKMSGTPGRINSMPQTLGQHNAEIFGELGYSAEDLERLRAEGAIR